MTCPVSRDNCKHVDRIRREFADEVDVIVLYTREAHPVGSASPYSEGGNREWITDRNINDRILFDEPVTLKERLQRAAEYKEMQKIESRVVVDSMDNAVWKAFGGGPNSGMLFSIEGEVCFRQGWLKPSVMAGEIRTMIVRADRYRIREKLKTAGLRMSESGPDMERLKEAMKIEPEIVNYHGNSKNGSNDETYLHLAVKWGRLEEARALIKLGADPNSKDASGLTPLHYALLGNRWKTDYTPLIKFILESGGSIQAKADDLRTALHFSAESGKLDRVRMVVNAGEMIDSASIDGLTPLQDAIFHGHKEIAEYLLEQGAAVDLPIAAALGDMKQVKRFLKISPNGWMEFQGDSGRTPLMYATAAGQVEMVEFLLSRQSETAQFSNEHLLACLTRAIELRKTSAALPIIDQALPPYGKLKPTPVETLHAQIPPGWRWGYLSQAPLHKAAEADDSQILERMLDRGWDVDELDAIGATPLHSAANGGSLNAVQFLLARGANINAIRGENDSLRGSYFTPLHLAVLNRNSEIVEVLLKNGAKTEVKDREGKTPLMTLHPVPNSGEKETARIFQLLIAAGSDVDAVDRDGRTLKDLAAKKVPVENENFEKVGEKVRNSQILELIKGLKKNPKTHNAPSGG